MDGTRINLTSLKDKIASKFSSADPKKPKVSKKKTKKSEAPKNEESRKPSKEVKSKPKASNSEEEKEEDVLRREALALGATEEDLALLNGIEEGEDSEQEFEDSSKPDKSFTNDLSKFMKGIGLDGSSLQVIDDDDLSEDDVPTLVEDDKESEDQANADDLSENSSEGSENEEEENDDIAEEQPVEKPVTPVKIPSKQELKDRESDKITDFSAVSSSKLHIPSRLDWYNTPLETIHNPEKLDRFAYERLFEKAEKIVEDDNKLYLQEFTANNSQKKFLSQILKDGTYGDKISALTLLVQEAPLHNLKALGTLIGFCEKKSRTAALQAINALKDLLTNGLLPDRKLIAFNKRQMTKDISSTHLAIYYFEDYLKKSYFKLIQVFETLCTDPIVHVKMNVVSHIFDLLKAKPEQEANLLRLGSNKLGDVENKVAGKSSYQILQLEQAHPAMKQIIVDAVIDVLFKPKGHHNAQYYSILTLNQTILTRKEIALANKLVNTYFSLFEKVLIESNAYDVEKKDDKALGKTENGRKNNRKNFKKGKKGGKSVKHQEKTEGEVVEERNSKIFSALLTGLNRAFPFSNLPPEIYEKHLETLYKITHSSNFNTSIQALVLIQHITTELKLNNDRFYRTLYESLLDPRLLNSSKQGIYLNLLFKSLKADKANTSRVSAFVKRIMQICGHWLNIGTIAGMFYLLSQLSKEIPQIADLTLDFNSRPDEEDETDAKNKTEPYDSRKRDPKYANAKNSSLWELNQFLNHYHPTIAIYAESILEGTEQPKPDLGLYTLSHFLDRFVYKNSKQKPVTKGSSIMQPLGGSHTGSLLVRATNVISTEVPVNTEDWLVKKTTDIKPDEAFFHQYFTTRQTKIKSKKDKKPSADSDEDLDDEDVWDALVKSRPEVEEESDDDSIGFGEDDFSDLDDNNESDENSAEPFLDADAEIDEEGISESEEEQQEEPEDTPDEGEDDLNESLDSDGSEPEMFGINDDDELSDDEQISKSEESKNSNKRSRKDASEKGNKKRKLKDLPVFASAEDYSEYLNSEDDEL